MGGIFPLGGRVLDLRNQRNAGIGMGTDMGNTQPPSAPTPDDSTLPGLDSSPLDLLDSSPSPSDPSPQPPSAPPPNGASMPASSPGYTGLSLTGDQQAQAGAIPPGLDPDMVSAFFGGGGQPNPAGGGGGPMPTSSPTSLSADGDSPDPRSMGALGPGGKMGMLTPQASSGTLHALIGRLRQLKSSGGASGR